MTAPETAPHIDVVGGRPEDAALTVSSTKERVVPFAVAALVCLVAVMTITPWPVGAFEDDGIYTVLARSLAMGDGYRLTNLPGSPIGTHYPPGYPFLLSLIWRLNPDFPGNVVLFKFANAVLLSLAAVGTWYFARRRLGMSSLNAGIVGILSTISIVVLFVAGMVLSEPMFLALLMPSLLLAENSAESGDWKSAALAGAVIGVLALVRTLGAIAIPAAAIVLLYRRHVRAAIALCTVSALFVVPWQMWIGIHELAVPPVLMGKYGSYGEWMRTGYAGGGWSFLLEVIQANVRGLVGMVGYMAMPVRLEWPRWIAFISVTGAVAYGALKLLPRQPVTAIFFSAYTATVLLWPFDANRFLWAVWPLVIITTWYAASLVLRWKRPGPAPRAFRAVLLLLLVAPMVGFFTYNVRAYRGQWWASIQAQMGERARPIVEWVARNTAPSDVVATEHDLIVHLYTGRRATPVSTFLPAHRIRPVTRVEDLEALRNILELYSPRYVIVGYEQSVASAEALAAESPPVLKHLGNVAGARVYERLTRAP